MSDADKAANTTAVRGSRRLNIMKETFRRTACPQVRNATPLTAWAKLTECRRRRRPLLAFIELPVLSARADARAPSETASPGLARNVMRLTHATWKCHAEPRVGDRSRALLREHWHATVTHPVDAGFSMFNIESASTRRGEVLQWGHERAVLALRRRSSAMRLTRSWLRTRTSKSCGSLATMMLSGNWVRDRARGFARASVIAGAS